MSTTEYPFGQEHVRLYQETDGETGHDWREGSTVLLLTTPLIYNLDGDTPVIVASKGGAPDHPGWFKNLAKTPEVVVQIKGDRFGARARVAEGEERERLWALMNEVWPHYEEYATKTDREIPVVVLEKT